VLWITKQAKGPEKHETLSRLSLPFVSFVVPNAPSPQSPPLSIHTTRNQRVNLRTSTEPLTPLKPLVH